METRANYVLIGAFTLAGFVGLLLFVMWFARVELDRQFSYYDIQFPSVSGLSTASEVRFSGLPVGQVVSVGLAPDGSGEVEVRIEVSADTPVRTSTVATIESLGVTGVSYIGLSAGEPSDELLEAASDDPVPLIEDGRSIIQTLSEDAPQIVEEVLGLVRQVRDTLGPDNQDRIANILNNLETSSENLGQAFDDFSQISDTIVTSGEEIAAFTGRLEGIAISAEEAIATAQTTMDALTAFAGRAGETLDRTDRVLETGDTALATAETYLREDLTSLTAELTDTAATVRAQAETIGSEAEAMLAEFRATGAVATARLEEAEATIAATDRMLADMSASMVTVEETAAAFDSFLTESGEPLVADARTLIANANRVAEQAVTVAEVDLPAIMEDIRLATRSATEAVETVSADLSGAAGRVDGISEDISATLATVTETFSSANETLSRIDTALETGDRALAAAESAFTSADRVLTDEVGGMTAALQSTVERLNAAIDEVSADLPQISADIEAAANSAASAFAQVERSTGQLTPALDSFSREGLPQYTRLARETRELIDNIDRLVSRIERDPARYLLGRDTPEFRR